MTDTLRKMNKQTHEEKTKKIKSSRKSKQNQDKIKESLHHQRNTKMTAEIIDLEGFLVDQSAR